jgi:predicted phosphodiesterase
MTPEIARLLVAEHGAVDRAALAGGFPVGKFRALCKANDIVGVRPTRPSSAKTVAAPPADDIDTDDALAQENRDLRLKVGALTRRANRDDRLLELAGESVRALKPSPKPARDKRSRKEVAQEAVLLWGDVHASEVITADESGGLNTYDWDEMLRRHYRVTESVLSFLDHRTFPVTKLHVAGMGDFLSGSLHDLGETNELPDVESCFQFGVDAGDWLADLAKNFDSTQLVAVHGNHARTTLKPTTKKSAVTNFDWLAMEILKLRVAGHPITVEASRSPHAIMQAAGFKFLVTHGDGASLGALQKRVAELEKTFSPHGHILAFLFGHFHQANALAQNRIIVNGSMVGPGGYSLRSYGGGAPAQQTLLLVHPTRGITEVLPLDLQATS